MSDRASQKYPHPIWGAMVFGLTLCAIVVSKDTLPQQFLNTTSFRALSKSAFIISIAVWILFDALKKGWALERATNYGLLCGFLFPIGVPYYLVRSRGWIGALKSLGLVFIYILGLSLLLVGVYELLELDIS